MSTPKAPQCPACGAFLGLADARYCSHCGASLGDLLVILDDDPRLARSRLERIAARDDVRKLVATRPRGSLGGLGTPLFFLTIVSIMGLTFWAFRAKLPFGMKLFGAMLLGAVGTTGLVMLVTNLRDRMRPLVPVSGVVVEKRIGIAGSVNGKAIVRYFAALQDADGVRRQVPLGELSAVAAPGDYLVAHMRGGLLAGIARVTEPE